MPAQLVLLTVIPNGLTADGSHLRALVHDGRARHLATVWARAAQVNHTLISNSSQKPTNDLYAEDLVRGYRIDIWDSDSRRWHSLHRRSETFQSTSTAAHVDNPEAEGFVSLSVTKKSGAADALFLHETLARWTGWSLSAPRPGTHLSRKAEPDQAVPTDKSTDPDYVPDPALPLVVTVAATPGSLPRLRIGTGYRMRARVVDVAGNGPSCADVPDDAPQSPPAPEVTAYLRHEPVLAPVLALRDVASATDPGSDLMHLVIRSYNDDPDRDHETCEETAQRHVAPPRVSALTAEQHGLFDLPDGRPGGGRATYDLIASREAEQLNIPYLPDPLARGATLANLPGTGTNTLGWVDALAEPVRQAAQVLPVATTGAGLRFAPLAGADPRPGSVTLVDFGDPPAWPGRRPFRLVLAERPDGADVAPAWDPTVRALSVHLPKAATASIELSSYVTPDNLRLLGAWTWLRQYADDQAAGLIREYRSNSMLAGLLDQHAAIVADWVRSALEGRHHQMTPSRRLRLTHAVLQPIGEPALLPMTASRQLGATDAVLLGGVTVHPASTARLELHASWTEYLDAPEVPRGYRVSRAQAQVDQLTLADMVPDGVLLNAANPPRPVGTYRADPDRVVFGGRPQAAPRHQLPDTRHYQVEYTARATSAFRDCFVKDGKYRQPDGSLTDVPLIFTRTSQSVRVSVPSSARPATPRVRYVVPTFGWQRQTSTNIKVSLRHGKGLRVYLDGPWFSSGEGELLGVILPSGNPALTDAEREQLKPFITQWGLDPIWITAAPMSALPAISAFPDRVGEASDLKIPELRSSAQLRDELTRLAVAGHEVGYDLDRRLWYCDLTVDPGDVYGPFVRLAVARYQPHSVPGVELSPVVLCHIAQLTADRSAVLTYDPYNPRALTLTVSGPTPIKPQPTTVEVTVQRRTDPHTDLGWERAPERAVTVTRDLRKGMPDVGLPTQLQLLPGVAGAIGRCAARRNGSNA